MTLVVLSLDNIFMVLQISKVVKIGAMKPIFLDSGSPRRERGVRTCVGMVCYKYIVHTHVGIGASKVAIKTCRSTNLAGTRMSCRTG